MNRNFESGTVVLVYCNFYAHWWLGLVSFSTSDGASSFSFPNCFLFSFFPQGTYTRQVLGPFMMVESQPGASDEYTFWPTEKGLYMLNENF